MSTGAPARRNARYTPLDADGPLPLQMVAAVPAIRRDPLAFLGSLVARYGHLVAFPMPRGAVLLVDEPAAVDRVLRDNQRNYSKQTVQYGSLSVVTGAGLLTSDGELWRRHRRLVQPAFHHGRLPGVVDPTVDAARRLAGRWAGAPGGVLDADVEVMRAMLEVVGRILFDADLSAPGASLVHAVDVALRQVVRRAGSPLALGPLRRLPTPSARRSARAVAELDRLARDLVAARRATGAPGEDLLGLLLAAADAEGGLSDAEIRDELVTLVIAGHETVASSLAWTLLLLARHPAEQQRLHAELDAVLDGGRAARWEDLARLAHTRAVVEESLRLYPPAWMISRRAVSGDELPREDGGTLPLPAGTLVLISPWLLHRRPADWPDPGRFDPDRFADPAARRAAYLPFGAGPRLCPGRELAVVQEVLVLATLLAGHRVELPPGVPAPRVEALVTLRPAGGLPLRLRPRRPPLPPR